MITGLIGLRPRMDNTVEVNPLIPEGKWDYFCLDNVLYHGRNLTICGIRTAAVTSVEKVCISMWMERKWDTPIH